MRCILMIAIAKLHRTMPPCTPPDLYHGCARRIFDVFQATEVPGLGSDGTHGSIVYCDFLSTSTSLKVSSTTRFLGKGGLVMHITAADLSGEWTSGVQRADPCQLVVEASSWSWSAVQPLCAPNHRSSQDVHTPGFNIGIFWGPSHWCYGAPRLARTRSTSWLIGWRGIWPRSASWRGTSSNNGWLKAIPH